MISRRWLPVWTSTERPHARELFDPSNEPGFYGILCQSHGRVYVGAMIRKIKLMGAVFNQSFRDHVANTYPELLSELEK